MRTGIAYTQENIGRKDPEYGGVLTDVRTLPVGTSFYVQNGGWDGRITMHEGVKMIAIKNHGLAGFPENPDDCILALSGIKPPKSSVKVHMPDGLHGYGIEYNHGPDGMDAPAGDFTAACRRNLLKPGSGWFWQSGSDRPNAGYQFFEYFGSNPEDTVRAAAKDVAGAIKVDVE